MTFEVCEDCGSRVYSLGCVNCREEDYIEVEFAEELAVIRSAEDARKDMQDAATRTGEE